MKKAKGKSENPSQKSFSDDDGMQVILQADAVAVGEDTSTWIDATLSLVDLGKVSLAKGAVWVGAGAESGEDAAFAIAEAEALALGADWVRVTTQHWYFGEGDSAYELTVMKIKAFDHEKWDGETKFSYVDKEMHLKHFPLDLKGNEARLSFDAKVEGKETLVSVDAFALAVEDALSQSSLLIIAEVG